MSNKPKFNPNLPFDVVSKPKFDPNQPFESISDVSQLESGLRGVAQGATLGFSDEIAGGLEALKDVALTDKQFSDLEQLYLKHRDESRKANKLAQEQNPISYGAGEVGGSLATAVVPGLNTAKLGTLGARVAANAGLGAVAGLGMSDADNAAELAKDSIKAAALSGGLTYGIEKASPYVKKGLDYVGDKASELGDDVAKKVGKGVFGVDEKATENYLAHSKDVNNAYSLGELADSVLNKTDETSTLNEMRKRASELSSKSWEALKKESSIPKNDILQAIEDGQNSLLINGNVIGKAQERAYNNLNDLSKQILHLPKDIDEPTLKQIIQNLDENINWNNPEMGPTNNVLKNLRTFIDTKLKTQNTNYKNAMEKVEDVTKSLQQVKSVFENRQNPENYDKFNKAVKNLINKDDMSAANLAVDKIEKHTGYDLRKDIVDAWTKAQFEKGDVNGSRKTLLGGMVGTAGGTVLGNPVLGGAVGSSVGYTADRYAGPIFKKLLDGKINAQEYSSLIAPKLGKFANPIMEAAKRGNQALASTHFILSQTNPEYRKKIREIEGNEK